MSDNKKKEYESDEQEESNQNPKNETPLITIIIILALIGFIYIYYKKNTTKKQFIFEDPLTFEDMARIDGSRSLNLSKTQSTDNLSRASNSFQSTNSEDVYILKDLIPNSFHSIDYTNLDNPSTASDTFHSFQPASSNSQSVQILDIPSFDSMNYSDFDSFPVKEGSFTPSYP